MLKKTLTHIWLPLLLLAFFLVVRLPALGRFVTTDEALWLSRSANFYLAINQGDWAGTYQSPHPGVVTMWAGAAAFNWRFPEYVRAGEAAIHDVQLLQLMENRGINPIEVLSTGRLVLVLFHAAAFLAAWPYARRLLGAPAAAIGMALLALDPFAIAHQRLLHLDGLLASLMTLSILGYIDFLQSRKTPALIVSVFAAGLAFLTKTPALFLIPMIVLISGWQAWTFRSRQALISNLQSLASWFLIAILIAFAFFPALWTAPLDIPAQMLSYALGSAEGEYSGPIFFNGVIYPEGDLGAAGWYFYPLSFLWRTTPFVLLGLLFAIWFATKGAGSISLNEKTTILVLTFFSIAFLIFMTIAGKKFDRYLLPAIPALILIAGWGWSQLLAGIDWLRRYRWPSFSLLAAAGILQIALLLSTFPYYLNYYNPLLGGGSRAPSAMMIGWGEGLDQAADYLKAQPGIENAEVAAWYSVSFNLLFIPQADDIPIAIQLTQTELDALLAKDYLVIYIHQWQRGTPQNLLDALASLEPEHRVWINGIEYARVYHLNEN